MGFWLGGHVEMTKKEGLSGQNARLATNGHIAAESGATTVQTAQSLDKEVMLT